LSPLVIKNYDVDFLEFLKITPIKTTLLAYISLEGKNNTKSKCRYIKNWHKERLGRCIYYGLHIKNIGKGYPINVYVIGKII